MRKEVLAVPFLKSLLTRNLQNWRVFAVSGYVVKCFEFRGAGMNCLHGFRLSPEGRAIFDNILPIRDYEIGNNVVIIKILA